MGSFHSSLICPQGMSLISPSCVRILLKTIVHAASTCRCSQHIEETTLSSLGCLTFKRLHSFQSLVARLNRLKFKSTTIIIPHLHRLSEKNKENFDPSLLLLLRVTVEIVQVVQRTTPWVHGAALVVGRTARAAVRAPLLQQIHSRIAPCQLVTSDLLNFLCYFQKIYDR